MKRYMIVVLVLALSITAVASEHITRQEAREALYDAEDAVIEVMEIKNETGRFNDSIDEARVILRRATYAAFIRNDTNSSYARQARAAMQGLDVDEYQYSNVLVRTEEIQQLRDTVFNLTDRMVATRERLDAYRDQGLNVSEAQTHLEAAREAYRQEQYEDVGEQLVAVDRELDTVRSQRSITDMLAATGAGFIDRYRTEIAIVLVVAAVLIGGTVIYYRQRKRRKRFNRLTDRLTVIRELMEDAQEAYFIDEDLSKSVYEARMETYRDRLTDTEKELATLADRVGREAP